MVLKQAWSRFRLKNLFGRILVQYSIILTAFCMRSLSQKIFSSESWLIKSARKAAFSRDSPLQMTKDKMRTVKRSMHSKSLLSGGSSLVA